MNEPNRSLGKLYTAYIVRDVVGRRYLNQKAYTGRRPGIWGRISESQVFYTEASAAACAYDINRRRPVDRPSSYRAEVVPIKLRGRGRVIED